MNIRFSRIEIEKKTIRGRFRRKAFQYSSPNRCLPNDRCDLHRCSGEADWHYAPNTTSAFTLPLIPTLRCASVPGVGM